MSSPAEHPNLRIIDHPLVQHKMALLRDEATSKKAFRELVDELSMLLAYEATSELPLRTVTVRTPLEETEARQIAGKKVVLVPILRAGLGMVDGVLRLMPSARVGHVGLYRDHDTLEPHHYYF
ncbi:MAG: uracil phosphoribosyltransferase, partial [Longimicrobiales bacterium]|nr:uracil phosphoribosyltransferase [Longimicrobiales bacterium]